MKSIDLFRDVGLPVPAEHVDGLISEYGRRLYPQFADHDPCLLGLDCSADGSTLIGFGETFLLVWNTDHSEPQNRLRLSGQITCAAISESGSKAIVGTASGEIVLLSIPDLELITQRSEAEAIHSVQISDADVAVFCDVQGHVEAFDFVRDEALSPIRHKGQSARLWLSADGELLIVDDERSVILCHTIKGWIENAFYYGYDNGELPTLAAGGWVVATRRSQVHIWNRGSASQAMILGHAAQVCAFDMTGTMNSIAVITADQMTHLHSPHCRDKNREPISAQTYVRDPHSIKLRGEKLFLGGRELTAMQTTRANAPVRTYVDRLIPIVSVHVSPDERWLTIGDQAGGITIYDTKEGNRALDRVALDEAGAISVVDVDHDAKVIIAGSHDGKLKVIQFGEIFDLRSLDGGGGSLQAACLVDRQACIGNSAGAVTRIDIETGNTLQQFVGHSALVRSITQFEDILVSTDQNGVICVFDYGTAALLQCIQVDDTAYSICLDEHGKRLYSGTRSGAIACWDPRSGELVDEIRLNRSVPRHIHIRGNTLVSLGLHGDLRLFDLKKHEPTLAIDIPGPSWQRFAYLNSSGTRVMTCGADGIMRFLCTKTGAERARGMHSPRGFLWFARDGENPQPEWLWTDQTENLNIVSQHGGNTDILPEGSDERQTFLLERNSKRTMAIVGLMPGLEVDESSGASLNAPLLTRRLAGPAT